MTTAAVMRVKDEADIVATTIRHLASQVDEIIVADNLSTDGTRELLHDLEDELPLTVEHDDEYAHYAGRVITGLARLALERGHEWVIPCDADEIWMAPGSTIRDLLGGVHKRTNRVTGTLYQHVPTALDPDDGNPVARMGWRLVGPEDYGLEGRGRVAFRLHGDIVIEQGNHEANTLPGVIGVRLLEIRHFPARSEEQFVRKAINGKKVYDATDLHGGYGVHWRRWGTIYEEGGEEALRDLYRREMWFSDPENDPSLIYDPALVTA